MMTFLKEIERWAVLCAAAAMVGAVVFTGVLITDVSSGAGSTEVIFDGLLIVALVFAAWCVAAKGRQPSSPGTDRRMRGPLNW